MAVRKLRKLRRRALGQTETAYTEALNTAQIKPEDAATVELGRRLAQLLDLARDTDDEGTVIIKLSGEFRAVLHSLKMTPISRTTNAPKQSEPATPQTEIKSSLQQQRDELAARRAQRASQR